MTEPTPGPPAPLAPPPGLLATRRLTVLDELGLPYDLVPSPTPIGSWAVLSARGRGCLHWFTGNGNETATGWRAGTLRIWGHIAPESEVAELRSRLPGRWTAQIPILDSEGSERAWIWRSAEGSTILPFDPDELIANLRTERYQQIGSARRMSVSAFARRVYYRIRPLLPRPAQIALRRAFSRVQARTAFPAWPVEPALHDLVDLVRQAVADAAGYAVPYIEPWPSGYSWALVLTHDVETEFGARAVDLVRGVEATAGYRSSWNLVPERYPVPDELVRDLKEAGCEVGVHGLRHDGRDLESLRTLECRLPEIRRWASRWGAAGFRSPATHRVWSWMPRLGFDYDSSYPDTDPYEPMGGGCCSWLPFFNDEMVELPITLPQDHTVFVILRRDESLWRAKAELLRGRGGMALAITHPDYMLAGGRLDAYRRLLDHFGDDVTAWKALPCEVSVWWRRRAATSLVFANGRWQPVGPGADEVAIGWVRPTGATPGPHGERLGLTDTPPTPRRVDGAGAIVG
ncbi:MAG TPA: hypothetical protein VHW04_06635 [Solirubrobacteraceae bacterium]|jgi:hypothetical protein|nr:hypothetical protein [Solirubrobacteraceae bacterium]